MNTIDLLKWANSVCQHDTTIVQRGNWGPHSAKEVCMDCNKHIRWLKTQQNPYEKRTGRKYVYGSNTGTKRCSITHK